MRDRKSLYRARKLRNQSTDAERVLWQHLRHKQVEGFRFRRQVPIGSYIADFACMEAQLVIELDGGQHQEQVAYDSKRDSQLTEKGWRVLRFWNNQVLVETPAVLEVIRHELLALHPHPALPPLNAGEGTQ